jgi:hypothetical protein
MGFLDKLLKKKSPAPQECVLIHLDGVNLPGQVYEENDLSTLEDLLIDAINRSHAGELDGNETGPEATTIFTYGPDADRLFAAMEPVLSHHPLLKGSRIVIRKGGPGSPQTEMKL